MDINYLLKQYFECSITELRQIGLVAADADEFRQWLGNKAIFYNIDQVAWNEDDYDLIVDAPESFCHINSLRIHKNFKLELSSGFTIRTDDLFGNYKYLELHSFNLINNCVIDYTYFLNRDQLISKGLILPCEYLGVTIPDSFIKTLINEVVIPKFGNVNNSEIGYFSPLMVSLFYFEKEDDYWKKCFEMGRKWNSRD